MLAIVTTGTIIGLDSVEITVEVDIAEQGFPGFSIVGLPDNAVKESRERVRSALANSLAPIPAKKVTVNLSPADIPKKGGAFDLPIAVGILVASGNISPTFLAGSAFIGELSLEGAIKSVSGVLPLALMAKRKGIASIYVPLENANEATVVKGLRVYPVATLTDLILAGQGLTPLKLHENHTKTNSKIQPEVDFADIYGQLRAKRAMIISASGGHNIALSGPAGSGKTLLARALAGILPPLGLTEAMEVTTISSVAGTLPQGTTLVTNRPFRNPHHTVSRIGLIGGGSTPVPGEVSMAHRGILFLDELPEFPRHVLESIRQPMEDGRVTISRAQFSSTFPANFMLVTAQNPCPCGNLGNAKKHCTCSQYAIIKYQQRVSGPLWDRIDLRIRVPAVEVTELTGTHTEINSETIRKQVIACRQRQIERFKNTNLTCNADMSTKHVQAFCQMDPKATEILTKAVDRYGLSARSYFRLIKVARTISDLDNVDIIGEKQVLESLGTRVEVE